MSGETDLNFWANWAAIGAFFVTLVGAAVGIWGYARFLWEGNKKKKALESYLKVQKQSAQDGKKGQQTMTHLIRHVGLTEDEILKISFESNLIERKVVTDKDGHAVDLLFEYADY